MKKKTNILLPLIVTVLLLLAAVLTSLNSATFARYTFDISGEASYQAALSPQPTIVRVADDGTKTQITSYQWAVAGGEQYTTFTVSNSNVDETQIPSQDMTVRIRVFIPEPNAENSTESNTETEEAINIGNLVFTLQTENDPAIRVSGSDYLSNKTPLFKTDETNGWVYSFTKTTTDANGVISSSEVTIPLKGGEVTDVKVTLTVQNTEIDCSNFVIYIDRID